MKGGQTWYHILKYSFGSASILSDSVGNVVGDQRFYPFGETRLVTGTMYTDRLFTRQGEMTGSGIYYYGARYYSPKLGRFLSADTIVPGYGNPQNLNRYSYVLNNPLRYVDPTGHRACGDGEDTDCSGHKQDPDQDPYPPKTTKPPKPNQDKNKGGCEQGDYSPRCPGGHYGDPSNLGFP